MIATIQVSIALNVFFFLVISFGWGYAQNNQDCATAIVICDDGGISFTPNGIGADDFQNPNNDPSCFILREEQSAWYYFEFNELMDSNSVITFEIAPQMGDSIDYDFMIFGPDKPCDNLGSPLRCSYTAGFADCDFCPLSGLGRGAQDLVENFTEVSDELDGFVRPLTVQPGEGYYLLIDFFVGLESELPETVGFNLSWGGSAKEYLNCFANPNCEDAIADAGADTTVCAGDVAFQLNGSATGVNGGESYAWNAPADALDFLSDSNIANPTVNIPGGFSGTIDYELIVTEGNCIKRDTVQITVQTGPEPTFTGATQICPGATTTLTAEVGYDTYRWENLTTGQIVDGPVLSNATAGAYRLRVTDGGNICPGVRDVLVEEFAAPDPFIQGDLVYCEGDSTTLWIDAGLGDPSWSTGADTDTIVLTDPGDYTLTLTTPDGCAFSETVTVTEHPLPAPDIIGPEFLCAGATDTLAAGALYAAYEWSDVDAGQVLGVTDSLIIDRASRYALIVTDSNGCMAGDTLPITGRDNPEPVLLLGGADFCSGDTVQMGVQPGFAGYAWNSPDGVSLPASNGPEIDISQPGTYALTVTDDFGCAGELSTTLDTFPQPQPTIEGTPAFCEGESTTLEVAETFANYRWNGGQFTAASVAIDSAGLYTVEVTDANQCRGSASVNVVENLNPQPQILGDSAICQGTFTTLAVTDTYASYSWSSGQTSPSLTVNNQETYSLTVTDDNGCTGTAAFDLTVNPNPQPQINGDSTICEGEPQVLDAGPGFASYDWSVAGNTQELEITTGGAFAVTVTDDRGCQGADSLTVRQFARPQPTISGPTDFCNGDSVTLAVAETFLTYNWSTTATDSIIQINSGGAYTVTVTDEQGCPGEAAVDVNERPLPQPLIEGDRNICADTFSVLSPRQDYAQHQWSTGAQTPELRVDSSGVYRLSVTDAFGCVGSSQANVTVFDLPDPGISGADSYCEGDSVRLRGRGGFFEYQWSTGDTLPEVWLQQPGDYRLTVTDNLGCQGVDTFGVEELPRPDLSLPADTAFCAGDSLMLHAGEGFSNYRWNNGDSTASTVVRRGGALNVMVGNSFGCVTEQTVAVTAHQPREPELLPRYEACEGDTLVLSAGAGFDDYEWSDGSRQPDLSVTAGDRIEVTVRDSNGCRSTAVTEVQFFQVTIPNILGPEVFCSGRNVSLAVQESFPEYRWSTGDSTSIITVDAGGDYTLTVTDANGCASVSTKTLVEEPSPQIAIQGEPSFCPDDSTVLSVGSGYLDYIWTDGSQDTVLTVDEPGVYGVLVRAANGCSSQDTVEVIERALPQPAIGDSVLFICPASTATLDAGAGFTNYNWSTGSTQQVLTVSEPGRYTVVVADSLGCTGEGTATVRPSNLPRPEIEGPLSLCPGATDTLRIDAAYPEIRWSNGEETAAIGVETGGTFAVTVTNAAGCTASDTVEVRNREAPEFEVLGDRAFCASSATVLSVDQAFPDYRWSQGGRGRELSIATPGAYSVTVTDIYGCQAEETLTVREIERPRADAGEDGRIDCNEPTITLGGAESSKGSRFVYFWEGPGIDDGNRQLSNPVIDAGGIYYITVVDTLNGCASPVDSVRVVDQTNPPLTTARALDQLDCLTDTVVLDAGGSALGSGLRYRWLNAEGEPLPDGEGLRLEVSSPGDRIFTVFDPQTGCTGRDTVQVRDAALLPRTIAGSDQQLDCANPTVVLDGSRSAQGAQFRYRWTTLGGNIRQGIGSDSATVDQPGLYILELLNTETGCRNTDTVEVIRDLERPVANAGPDRELGCAINFVELDGTASSAGGQFSYLWTSPDHPDFFSTSGIPATEAPGQYVLLVTNRQNNCRARDTVSVRRVEDGPQAIVANVRGVTCDGDSDGWIDLVSVTGGDPPYAYRLDNNVFVTDSRFDQLPPGNYELSVRDRKGCVLDTNIVVENGPDPQLELGSDVTIREGDVHTLQAITNLFPEDIAAFRWISPDTISCDTCMILDVAPPSTAVYRAQIINTEGCEKEDFVRVFVSKEKNVYIPNAFSPNNDGINDRFFIQADRKVRRIKTLRIFDRWGNLVYEAEDFPPNDPAYGWDGRHPENRAKSRNAAVFVYAALVEFASGEEELFKGEVVLMQ